MAELEKVIISSQLPLRVSSVTVLEPAHTSRSFRSHSLSASPTVEVNVPTRSKHPRTSPPEVRSLPRFFRKNLSYGAQSSSMSIIRRYFLCFVFLDLVIHFVAYLLYLRHARDFKIVDLMQCQMNCYDIHSSFMDVIVLAVLRFLILESTYGWGRSSSWVGTALTTAMTSVFIIVKPFHYDWGSECQRLLPFLIMVLSFILPWLEAFFVDFRLIKMETLAQKYLAARPDELRKDVPVEGFLKSIFPITTDLFTSFFVPSEKP